LRKLAFCWALLTIIGLLLIKINREEENDSENNEDLDEILEPELTVMELI